MANDYTFNQIATVLNSIVSAAQGRAANSSHTPTDTSEFVTMAQTALTTVGMDPIMSAVSQMVNRTVFAFRPYNRKFRMLENSDIAYGNVIRKVTPIFKDGAEDQPMYDSQPADGQATNPWTIKRPKALQTVFVGAEQYEIQAPTVFADQLKTAFRGPDELARFLESQTGEVQNEIEQQAEALARNTIANLVGAIWTKDHEVSSNGRVIHLLSEYYWQTGVSLTTQTLYQPSNFAPFIKWMYARMGELADRMTNRSVLYHDTIGDNVILRHTPKADQRLLIYAPILRQIETMVLSSTYHDDLLRLAEHEDVTYWQDFEYPTRIDVTPTVLNTTTGAVAKGDAVSVDNIVAVMYDRNAMGTNLFMESVDVTPMNAKGRYYNTYHHFAKRYWNDTTENALVFVLD